MPFLSKEAGLCDSTSQIKNTPVMTQGHSNQMRHKAELFFEGGLTTWVPRSRISSRRTKSETLLSCVYARPEVLYVVRCFYSCHEHCFGYKFTGDPTSQNRI